MQVSSASTAATDDRKEGAERRRKEATRADQGAPIDWSDVDVETARTILRQGELYLDAQLRIALAADQKALVAAGILSGFATAVAASALAYWTQTHATALLIAGLVTAAVMVVGAFLCLWAVKPDWFALPGNEPAKWWKVRYEKLSILVGLETENYQRHIETNDASIKEKANLFKLGMNFGLSAPVLGTATWLLAMIVS